jgi:hypothetical protein
MGTARPGLPVQGQANRIRNFHLDTARIDGFVLLLPIVVSIWSSLADLPDPRNGNARRHNLLDVLTIALTASIFGVESCVDFARDREAMLGMVEARVTRDGKTTTVRNVLRQC